jgi:hypothetical protein
MYKILQKSEIDNLPVQELSSTLHAFLEPVSMHLPEKRLRDVGTLGSRSGSLQRCRCYGPWSSTIPTWIAMWC